MIRQVNAPVELETVECYKCKALIKIHPETDINSPWIVNCYMHNPKNPSIVYAQKVRKV